MKKYLKSTLLAATSLAVLAGCNGGEAPVQNPGNTDTPAVTDAQKNNNNNEIFIYTVWPGFYVQEEVYERQVGQYLKQKFPEFTFKHVAWDDGRRYEDLVAANTIPDIIMDNARMNLQRYIMKNDLQFDMRDLIKKHNFDLNTLEAPLVAQMQNVTASGDIYGLPWQVSDFVTFYNIDIFDKFGVPHLTDGMTYDEMYELAKRLTRVEGEITYKGYQQHPGLYMNYNQLSLGSLHPTEDRALLTTDSWKRHVDNLRRFYEIPANQFTSVDHFPLGRMAISVHVSEKIVQWYDQNPQLNFDIVSMPSYSDLPGVKAQPNMYSMYITKQSTKKDEAFKVIQYLLSEEYQIELAKEGIKGPMNTDKIKAAFGANLPQMQGKNTGALFYGPNAMPPAARAAGLTYIDVPVHQVFQPLIFGESKDSMTALRMTEEATNKGIDTIKAAAAE